MENSIIYKIYKGESKGIAYTTFNIDDAVRKYFMHIKENPVMQIWKEQQLIGEYSQCAYDLKAIKINLESIIKAA